MHELNFLQIFKAPAPYVQMNHPRACGEKGFRALLKAALLGSPPRMRGKECRLSMQHCLQRITPAHAGKSFRGTAQGLHSWDHPRACGEKTLPAFGSPSYLGSPPRIRGKVFKCQINDNELGDHPRACGEKCLSMLSTSSSTGSPPRMRGKGHGITARKIWYRDHPRACGEKRLRGGTIKSALGSPPRMRGKDALYAGRLGAIGITPAHAGKSHRALHYQKV